MKIKSVQIKSIKGFLDSGGVDFSPSINVLIGHNNAGKSTLLKSIYLIQKNDSIGINDTRIGANFGQIEVEIENINSKILRVNEDYSGKNGTIRIRFLKDETSIQRELRSPSGTISFSTTASTEPDNFIYPCLSKRKVTNLDQQVNIEKTKAVSDNLIFLHAKINRISNPQYQPYAEYNSICRQILGFSVTPSPSEHGVRGGLIVNNFENIPLETMGDGVPNILGLIVDLCIAEQKLFLIEEPENDIHPKALKSLLEFIIQKSKSNQFIITTHSNIVAKYLGAEAGSRLFHVTSELINNMPTSTIKPIGDSADERVKVLEDLGYELFDFDLYKAYLILEESSAERIIRDFLIPEFVPELVFQLKTIASQGISNVEPRFNDFDRLFVFIHTSPAYKNRAWVLVDGDEEGHGTIKKMKEKYNAKGWDESHFKYFSKDDFEEFYPDRFKNRVASIPAIVDKQRKRDAKKELLEDVLKWINTDKETAKVEFEKSAAEVISILRSINEALKNNS